MTAMLGVSSGFQVNPVRRSCTHGMHTLYIKSRGAAHYTSPPTIRGPNRSTKSVHTLRLQYTQRI
eukprot:3736574-Pleurochrysis_carterae.AAC.1